MVKTVTVKTVPVVTSAELERELPSPPPGASPEVFFGGENYAEPPPSSGRGGRYAAMQEPSGYDEMSSGAGGMWDSGVGLIRILGTLYVAVFAPRGMVLEASSVVFFGMNAYAATDPRYGGPQPGRPAVHRKRRHGNGNRKGNDNKKTECGPKGAAPASSSPPTPVAQWDRNV